MRTKTFTKIISLIVINALTALLIFQINFAGGKSSPTQAETTSSYSATWTINKCRIANDSIDIGPASWDVSYTINGVVDAITEKWEATFKDFSNGSASVSFSTGTCKGLTGNGLNNSWGLYGFTGANALGNSIPVKWSVTKN